MIKFWLHLVQDVDGKYGYIAAQGPMPHTVNDFWRMMWEYNTEIVFMVCRLKEDGKVSCLMACLLCQ